LIYLLYGPDTYRSRKKLNEIIEGYRAKAGSDFNFHRFDAEEDGLARLNGIVETSSLFGGKKLVVVEQALLQESFAALMGAIEKCAHGSDTVLVLYHRGELDEDAKKQLGELKPHLTSAQEFRQLCGEALRRWIREEAALHGVRLERESFMHLASRGSDLWAIANELEKQALSRPARKTTARLGKGSAHTSSIFMLGDTFFTAPRQALTTLLGLRLQGHDEFNLFSYLANHTRTLLTVKAYAGEDRPVPSAHGLHPYVVKKATVLVRQLSLAGLVAALHHFFEEDWKIKTGLARPHDALVRLLFRSSS